MPITFSPRPLVREAAVVLFFLGLAAVATRPLVADPVGHTLPGPDPMIDLWTVHWLTSHALEPRQLFGGNIFHPAPNAILYSDLSLGTAVLLVPFRPLLADPVPLYNLGVLLALSFAGWAFCALARDLTGNVWAGLLAGVLAAFGSHQLFHIYHLNLLSTGWLALFLLGLHRLARQPSWGAALLAGVSFSLAAQSSGYYAVGGAIVALVFGLCHWRAFRDPRGTARLAAAAVLAALLTAPYLNAFLAVRERDSLRRPVGMSVHMAFQPRRDISSHAFLYRDLLGGEGERLFPGLLPLVLGALALARRRPGAGFYAAATAVLLVVSLGPRLEVGRTVVTLPYAWLFAVPPLDAMRHPYTFAAIATFTLAVQAAIGWCGLRLSARPWAGPLIVAVAVLETLAPGPDVREAPPGLPPAYERLESLPPGPVLEVPVFEADTLLWAARHQRPVLNGAGAFAPVDTLVLERFIDRHWLKRVPEDVDDSKPTEFLLDRFPVRYVILATGRRPALGGLAAAFDRSRTFVLAAEASDGDRIYEVRK